MALDYGPNSTATTGIVREALYQNPGQQSEESIGRLIKKLRDENYKVLAGHFPLTKYGQFFAPDSMFTFIREPLVRCASEYLHHQRHNDNHSSFEEFINTPRNQNLQSKYLHSIHPDTQVFVTEDFEKSIRLFNEIYDLRLKAKALNVGPKGGAKSFLAGLSPSLKTMFYSLNANDVDLYRQLKTTFDLRVTELATPPKQSLWSNLFR